MVMGNKDKRRRKKEIYNITITKEYKNIVFLNKEHLNKIGDINYAKETRINQ